MLRVELVCRVQQPGLGAAADMFQRHADPETEGAPFLPDGPVECGQALPEDPHQPGPIAAPPRVGGVVPTESIGDEHGAAFDVFDGDDRGHG